MTKSSDRRTGPRATLRGVARGAGQLVRGRGRIFAGLARDHAAISGLIDELADADSPDERRQRLQLLRDELREHAEVEDQVVYRAVEGHSELAERIERYRGDHEAMEALIADLPPYDGPQFERKVEHLRDLVLRHVREEERDLFPLIDELLSDTEQRSLLASYRARRAMARRRPSPGSPGDSSDANAPQD